MTRRAHLAAFIGLAAMLVGADTAKALEARPMEEVIPEFGLIGQIIAQPGRRAELAALMSRATRDMPGSFGYFVGEDAANADALWVVELWENAEAHRASLRVPAIAQVITQARPLIASFGARHEFRPVRPTASA